MTRRIWTGSLSALGLLLLILDAKTALYGASQGMVLCLRSVIPSLFPFFALSILLTDALTGFRFPILRPVGKLCGLPQGGESLLAVGLLGGYPVGAQSVAQAYRAGQLTKQDARRMLGFCSNAGPAFLFGMVASKFPQLWMAWVLWGIHILSALVVGVLLPGKSKQTVKLPVQKQSSLSNALRQSVTVMAGVCGWVVLFRVIIAFLDRWCLWLFPDWAQVAVTGLLELANGCCELDRIENSGLRFIICSAILGFGGLCVTMQTVSVTDGLGLGWYLPGKLIQGLVSVILAALLQMLVLTQEESAYISPVFLIGIGIILSVSLILMHKFKKRSSISAAVGV